ncbi:MAG: hypothetical protein NWE93_01725 [Candidatus Bathyarchaeota archaeon]|nr:hypothetical protein [Candidatus Bathyarchaeota archaeon]
MSEGSGKNKPLHEHIASILPFRVLEATEGKPLRIAGVAMTAGMSRNHNVYTPEELQAFAPKLIGSPLYLEHVTVNNAIGKVTNCTFDAQTKGLLYEAEIYDPTIAEKIRNGLIQHVSVGADYDTLDSANVPHGLHNAEMSLVAVPGIPETNIQVLESLRNGVEGLDEKDIESVAEKVAAKIGEKNSLEIDGIKTKLSETEGKLVAAEGKLAEANRTVEQLKQLVPGVDLLKNPSKLMPVSEAVKMVKEVLPAPMIQRSWRLGPQRMCQDLQRVIHKLEDMEGSK